MNRYQLLLDIEQLQCLRGKTVDEAQRQKITKKIESIFKQYEEMRNKNVSTLN